MLKINVLGSGSSGNCALVRCGDSSVLIDVGLSAKMVCSRLEAIDFDPGDLSAILLTHEHGDHVRGLDVFCKKADVPVYCNALTRESLQKGLKHPKQWRIAQAGSRFMVGGIEVAAFSVIHDAVDPMGYVLSDGESRLGIVSDIGHVTKGVRAQLTGVDTLFVEANYDLMLLQNDTKRPWSTKQRIVSRHGHLSNEQTAELVVECAATGLQNVVLGHLSQDCNSPEVAVDTIERHLAQNGHFGVSVHCAGADGLEGTLEVAAAARKSGAESGGASSAAVWVQAELF
ncbi:MAG: MBL fold metallo-hydrolase [Verrucomicrobiales bacterium]